MTTPCPECGTPLAHDQRYCVECGARRGPLPSAVATLIGAATVAGSAADTDGDVHRNASFAMPAPRAAAAAVLGLLAFGVAVGSLVAPPPQTAASAPLVVAIEQPAPAPAAPVATPSVAAEPQRAPRVSAPAPTPSAPPASPRPQAPPGGGEDAPGGSALPAVRHVFLIVLAGHGYDQAFGANSPARYLTGTLVTRGELLPNYYAVTQGELANEIALLSGQGPTLQTAGNCPDYRDIAPRAAGDDGQVTGDGCVYPAQTPTLADQLTADGETWKAYVEDVGSGPAGEPATCRHPALGTTDAEHDPRPGDAYVTWRNPFVYFHSLIDGTACRDGDVGLDELERDLRTANTTPSFVAVVPSRCHDGAEQPCAPGRRAGLPAADAFLRTLVPRIERSPAYRDGGLIAITFDQAPQDGPDADSSACCDTPAYPNLGAAAPAALAAQETPAPTPSATPTREDTPTALPSPEPTATPSPTPSPARAPTATPSPGPTPQPTATPSPEPTPTPSTTPPAPSKPPGTGPVGGGRVGLLLVSSFVKPGSVNVIGDYNHFSLLRSIEDLFGLDHLGYAADPALPAFDRAVYNAEPSPQE